MKRRILTFALALCMLLTLLPMGASAQGDEASLMSLMPLTKAAGTYTFDLSGYTLDQARNVPLSDVISAVNAVAADADDIQPGSSIAWAKKDYVNSKTDDDYKVIHNQTGATLDLTNPRGYSSQYCLELIVGSAKQLDTTNKIYDITVTTDEGIFSVVDIYTQSGGTRTKVTPNREEKNTYDTTTYYNEYIDASLANVKDFYVGLILKTAYNTGYNVKVYYTSNYSGNDTLETVEAKGIDVTSSILGQTMTNTGAGYVMGTYGNYAAIVENTTTHQKECCPFRISIESQTAKIGLDNLVDTNGEYSLYLWSDNNSNHVIQLQAGKSADAEYKLSLYYTPENTNTIDNSKVDKAVVGTYSSLEAASAATDIKDSLFNSSAGYQSVYKDPVNLTVFAEGKVFNFSYQVKAVEQTVQPNLKSEDVYFRVNGAINGDTTLDCYKMPSYADTYYSDGYQTVLINAADANLTTLKPVFYVKNPPQAYASETVGGAAQLQVSGVSQHDFSNRPVQYTAKAEDGSSVKNYWVTFVAKTAGTKLYVNGPDEREVFLDDAYDNEHDVFVANVGDTAITNLNVTLTNAKNIELDEYWTVGGENNNTLAAFTKTNNDQVDNTAKIRLLPTAVKTGNGEIEGTLTITGGTETRTITLTGYAGNPDIITSSVANAVKYVPYSVMIQTSNHHDWNKVTFSKTSGTLPAGVSVLPNGEIYGVPTETGTFTFTVKADYSYNKFESSTKEYTLVVDDNTDENVTRDNQTILDSIQNISGAYTDQVFRIDHVYGEFAKFFIDGQLLVEGTDYTSEEGSTKITIRAQTLANKGPGKHTGSAEFRTSDNIMTKSSQNYTSTVNGGNNNPNRNNNNNYNNTTPTNPTTPVVTGTYSDVAKTDWFYNDVMWAYDNGYMNGVGNRRFDPKSNISQSMIVTILFRMAKADASQLTSENYTGITAGKWYSDAAAWASSVGLIDATAFNPDAAMTRGQLAVMLVKYLDYMKIPYTVPTEPVAFSDSASMTAEENAAFQVLNSIGIFKGYGNNDMQPFGNTSRAEMAALAHRVADFAAANSTKVSE